ncbi:hypothetical protein B4U80_02823 [Leptotrombidium deliense]|uniref:Tyrosyl-DNA phosphodiesterase 2 n=1 Tax=Leptotrombidium deliense TaxID=299467 RepID=A0A443S6E9_9ACAR|nr:hypothetical protein B4U80_02823 [Leptotrombidium deliense]
MQESSEPQNSEEFSDEQCQKFVEQFVELTDTDEALAQFFLQDRNWDVSIAVHDYFRSLEKANAVNPRQQNKNVVQVTLSDSSDEESCMILHSPKRLKNEESDSLTLSSSSSRTVRFITWNIDGLSEKNLFIRTEAVCSTILSIGADIVHLQEVVSQSELLIKEKLQNYAVLSGRKNEGDLCYYTLTLLNKNTVQIKNWKVIDFRSTMGRNVIEAEVIVYGIDIILLNSHLESTKSASDTRSFQLSQILGIIKEVKDQAVIFAGDMNLRDSEVLKSLGGLPNGVVDVWQATGCRKECEYTWDMTRNDNLEWRSSGKKGMPPRCRFDRIFFRDSRPSRLFPLYFGLIGIERLKPFVCFPSDHWGLFSQFGLSSTAT